MIQDRLRRQAHAKHLATKLNLKNKLFLDAQQKINNMPESSWTAKSKEIAAIVT